MVTAYVGFVDVPAKLPAKYAFEIDATRGRLLRVTVTTFGGESRAQRAPNPHFVATPPLAEADFALPANLTRLRPRNQAEFIKVQREHER